MHGRWLGSSRSCLGWGVGVFGVGLLVWLVWLGCSRLAYLLSSLIDIVVLFFLFGAIGAKTTHACKHRSVQAMYPELLKRLDDSNDDVRRTICATIAMYFKAPAPGAFSSTCYGYMLDTLLVHLDDPEEEMQVCVLDTLNAAIDMVPKLVAAKALKAVDSHRDGDMAEGLAQRAAKKVEELSKTEVGMD